MAQIQYCTCGYGKGLCFMVEDDNHPGFARIVCYKCNKDRTEEIHGNTMPESGRM